MITLEKLKSVLTSPERPGSLKRQEAIAKFRDSNFGIEALPFLVRSLRDENVVVVIRAAECIAKLGPDALTEDISSELIIAGGKVWKYSGYCNCYSPCLNALIRLKEEYESIIEYIHAHIGLSEYDLVHSLEALKEIGTPKALDLFKRAVVFWLPELNKTFTKKVKALAATVK